jgi:hypothetical protein
MMDDCCEGGKFEVMSEESSENCVSGLLWIVDLLGLKRTNDLGCCVIRSQYTHVVDTDRRENKRKNHDLMTDCVMISCMWR